jgi:hypothetical protein
VNTDVTQDPDNTSLLFHHKDGTSFVGQRFQNWMGCRSQAEYDECGSYIIFEDNDPPGIICHDEDIEGWERAIECWNNHVDRVKKGKPE